MAYPNEVDTFTDKLNKSDTVYVIEEEVELTNGVYEGLLKHDNIVDSSVHVYTGPKLTGDKVDNFILSIPSKEKWRRIIKIFSSVSPVFITYESYGDQIEADDVNRLQTSLTSTQMEVNRYKAANDLIVNNTVNRVTTLENKKADKTYVDTELLKKADKATTYTKTETDARIQAVVDAAPAALDTLNEIAAALNDDPNFAATMTTELSKKVDKVAGKQLSTNDYTTTEKAKLAGIEADANKYVHPSTHPATMIVEDSTRRFVSDAEKSNWNGKLDATANAVSASKLATGRTIALSGDVTGSVVFDGSGNVTITSTVVDDTHNHVISNVDGLQAALDAKETPTGAQAKVDVHANRQDNPHAVTKAQVGLSNVEDVQQATKAEFNTHATDVVRHITSTERDKWNTSAADLTAHLADLVKHITGAERTAWNKAITDLAAHTGNKSNPHGVTTQQVNHLGMYTRKATDTATAYPMGLSIVHVQSGDGGGWQSYGSVITARGYDAGGGTLQIYVPYADGHGGTALQYRKWQYQATAWDEWASFETTAGAQAKVNTHAADTTKHITATERTAWNAKSNLALGETSTTAYRGDYGKIAYTHSQAAHAPSNAQKNSDITKAEIEAKLTGNITSHTHSQYVTQEQLGNAGYGDMLKSVYDSNGNGVVDAAESVPWAGVTGKPSTFAPAAHTHAMSDIVNLVSSLAAKQDAIKSVNGVDMNTVKSTGLYYGYNMTNSAVPTISTFIVLQYSGDWVTQIQCIVGATNEVYIRSWYNSNTWSPWKKINANFISDVSGLQTALDAKMKKGPLTWNDLKGV